MIEFLTRHKKVFVIITNILLSLLWARFAYVNFAAFIVWGNISTLLLAIAETLMVFIFIFRQEPRATSTRISDWVIAFSASALPTLLRPGYYLNIWQADVLSIIGGCLLIASYISLNKSFGIVPALRDIQDRGMYAIARHPIYASYFFMLTGFCLNNISFLNLLVMISFTIIILIRISREETFLLRDPLYNEYRKRVPWKLVPFIY